MNKKLKLTALIALIAVCCICLVACVPANPDKAISNLEKAGYTAGKDSKVIPAALAVAQVKGIDCVVTGLNGKDYVTLVYFTDKKSADAAYDKVESYAKKEDKESVIKKSGKVIYYGTEAGIKAVK